MSPGHGTGAWLTRYFVRPLVVGFAGHYRLPVTLVGKPVGVPSRDRVAVERDPSMDSMRFFAVALIILFHFLELVGSPGSAGSE